MGVFFRRRWRWKRCFALKHHIFRHFLLSQGGWGVGKQGLGRKKVCIYPGLSSRNMKRFKNVSTKFSN